MNACPSCEKEIPGTASACEEHERELTRDVDILNAKQVRQRMLDAGFALDDIIFRAYIQHLEGEK